MGDKMRQIPFDKLMEWVFTEFFHDKSIFGVSKFYKKLSGETLNIFNEKLELPFGPAAGPKGSSSFSLKICSVSPLSFL